MKVLTTKKKSPDVAEGITRSRRQAWSHLKLIRVIAIERAGTVRDPFDKSLIEKSHPCFTLRVERPGAAKPNCRGGTFMTDSAVRGESQKLAARILSQKGDSGHHLRHPRFLPRSVRRDYPLPEGFVRGPSHPTCSSFPHPILPIRRILLSSSSPHFPVST